MFVTKDDKKSRRHTQLSLYDFPQLTDVKKDLPQDEIDWLSVTLSVILLLKLN